MTDRKFVRENNFLDINQDDLGDSAEILARDPQRNLPSGRDKLQERWPELGGLPSASDLGEERVHSDDEVTPRRGLDYMDEDKLKQMEVELNIKF